MPLPLIHAYSQALWGKKNPRTPPKTTILCIKKAMKRLVMRHMRNEARPRGQGLLSILFTVVSTAI